MAKNTSTYMCAECGWESAKWQGQCRVCKAWSTMQEQAINPKTQQQTNVITPTQKAEPITKINTTQTQAQSTGLVEVDRILGEGIVPGSVILLAGEPGVGKSTLLMQIAIQIAKKHEGKNILYVSGEESASQVTLRAKRIGQLRENILLASENDLSTILGHIKDTNPTLVIVDSIQTITTSQIDGVCGSVAQIKMVANELITQAKTKNIPIILVGHVTKDGNIAGPRVLEHLVDVVCQFEGEQFTNIRMLRAVKNRYGPTDELGCFEINEEGMKELSDSTGLFISENRIDTVGSCVSIAMEGRRPLPIEIQALVAGTNFASPRRTSIGIDNSRVAMMLAVLQTRLRMNVQNSDVYVSTVGGAKINDVALDLAVMLAIISASINKVVPHDVVAFGEVGLTGDIRKIMNTNKRIQQASALGFKKAILPAIMRGKIEVTNSIEIVYVQNIAQVIEAVWR